MTLLWIYNAQARNDDIVAGAMAAEDLLKQRGYEPDEAHAAWRASLAGDDYDALAAQAWTDAEATALCVAFTDHGKTIPFEGILDFFDLFGTGERFTSDEGELVTEVVFE